MKLINCRVLIYSRVRFYTTAAAAAAAVYAPGQKATTLASFTTEREASAKPVC